MFHPIVKQHLKLHFPSASRGTLMEQDVSCNEKRPTWRWKQRVWFCVVLSHGMCRGWGREMPGRDQRPTCWGPRVMGRTLELSGLGRRLGVPFLGRMNLGKWLNICIYFLCKRENGCATWLLGLVNEGMVYKGCGLGGWALGPESSQSCSSHIFNATTIDVPLFCPYFHSLLLLLPGTSQCSCPKRGIFTAIFIKWDKIISKHSNQI